MNNDNVIKIGKKPIRKYIEAGTVLLGLGNKEITIAARGNLTWKAVTVSQLLKKLLNLKIKNIEIDGEDVKTEKGLRMVSVIRITLEK